MRKTMLIFLSGFMMMCSSSDNDIAGYKAQIAQTEKEFEAAAKAEGLASAFSRYADETAVISRGGKLVKGKDSIRMFYEKASAGVHLSWTPDFVDVAASGDIGYTHGKYLYEATDSLGKSIQSHGIFHTVWKRQPDESWKYVWD